MGDISLAPTLKAGPSWPPRSAKEKIIRSAITIVVALLLGGGGSFALTDYSTPKDVDAKIETHAQITRAQSDALYLVLQDTVDKQGTEIKTIGGQVGEIRSLQIQEIARREARRVTKNITSRQKRESEYDRILELNMHRLEKGGEPCGTLVCD